MKNYLEIMFWKLAIRIIKKGYGADCPDYDERCASCRAKDTIGWVEDHISLIKS